MREPLYVIFDGPPSHESGRFVEVETADGKSVNAGTWENHSGKYWRLGPLYREPQASRLETGAMTDCCGGNCLMRCPPAAPAATPPEFETLRLYWNACETNNEAPAYGRVCSILAELHARLERENADLRGKLEKAKKCTRIEVWRDAINLVRNTPCKETDPFKQEGRDHLRREIDDAITRRFDAALKEASNG